MASKNTIFVLLAVIITVAIFYGPYTTSFAIAQGSGPVLSMNWWNGLNWMKANIPECSIVATYWDPGHFITGIAERPVVFDGATQNSLWTKEVEGRLTEEEIKKIAVIDNYDYEYEEKDGKTYTKITTARIQDISTTLLTDNETLAINILKKYQGSTPAGAMPSCNNFSIYYIASGDLIGKSQWWTYFSTWSRQTHSGTKYFYSPVELTGQPTSIASDNATVYVYSIGNGQSFFLYEKNGVIMPYFQQGQNKVPVEKLFYFSGNTGLMQSTQEDTAIKGMLWVSPDMSFIIFVPPELENAMFTKLYLLNGQGLDKFHMVNNFGGEMKLFSVDLS